MMMFSIIVSSFTDTDNRQLRLSLKEDNLLHDFYEYYNITFFLMQIRVFGYWG